MGSTDENTLANSSASKRSTTDKRITIPSTENIKLELDESFNVSATLKRQSKPIVSLDLLDDLEISTEFSHRIRGFAPRTGRPLFCMKSAVPGIFALGGDLALFRYYIERREHEGLKRYARKSVRAVWALLNGINSNYLTVSFVNGEAQGGGFEAAAGCNVLVATRDATFGFPEGLFGLFPGMGAEPILTARADAHAAKTLISSSGRYSAEMLFEMGIIDYLIKEDEFSELANELSEKAKNDESMNRFTDRFRDIKYEDLVDTVDEWTSQALELDQRKIDVMGVILKAQNRLLSRRAVPSISKISSPLTIEDFDTVVIARNGKSGPLVLSPKSDNGLDVRRSLNFLRDNSIWINRTVLAHGAILLHGFSGKGIQWMKSVATSLKGTTRKDLIDLLSAEDAVAPGILRYRCNRGLPSFRGGAFSYPAEYTYLYRDSQPIQGGELFFADGRELLRKLPQEILNYFVGRKIVYKWILPNEKRKLDSNALSWQGLFETGDRAEVVRACFEKGLFCEWTGAENTLEVWTESPAIELHPTTGERVWRNAIHDFELANDTGPQLRIKRSLILGNGETIPSEILREIKQVVSNETLRVRWAQGDLLIVDNHQIAFGCGASEGSDETYLMSTFNQQ